MGTITCKDCGKQTSDELKYCSHYGNFKPKKKDFSTLLIIGAGLVATALIFVNASYTKTPSISPEETKTEQLKEIISMGRSFRCESWIKSQLKDPDSFESIETKYLTRSDEVITNVKYRARNSFNGFVVDTATCRISLQNEIIEATAGQK